MTEGYLASDEDRAFLRSLPLERADRKVSIERLAARLLSERRLFEGGVLVPGAAPLYAFVLADGTDQPGLRSTLRTLALQSAPDVKVTVAGLGPPGVAPAGGSSVSYVPHVTFGMLAGVPDSAFLVFLRPGDLLHPGAATALARRAAMTPCDAVVLSEGFYKAERKGRRLGTLLDIVRHGPFDPLSVAHMLEPAGNIAWRAGLARAYGSRFFEDAMATDLRLPALWLAGRSKVTVSHETEILLFHRANRTATASAPHPFAADCDRYENMLHRLFPACALKRTGLAHQPYLLMPLRQAARISVVIPFRDKPELTCAALASIFRQDVTCPVEIILVNNQSTDASLQTLRGFLSIKTQAPFEARIIDYDKPFNHSFQCELGFQESRGDVVVLMNNDTEFLSLDALDTMARFALLPDVATVGIRLQARGGELVCAGFRPRLTVNGLSDSPVEEWRDPHFSRAIRRTIGNSFALAAMSRAAHERIGPLDGVRFPNGYNDVEYCLRALTLGMSHYCLGHLDARHEPNTSRVGMDESAEKLTLRHLYPTLSMLPLMATSHESLSGAPCRRPSLLQVAPKATALPPSRNKIGRVLVVISYYDRRPDDHLRRLLGTLASVTPGVAFDVAIVVNSTGERRLELPPQAFKLEISYRENLGMNIGAWDFGWRHYPDYDAYVFLQDECFIIGENWLAKIVERLCAPEIGLVGESFNEAWNFSWWKLALLHAGATLPDHLIEGRPASRVACYLHFLRRQGIPTGAGGRHLRSLVWAARRDVLKQIDGFPIGRNYGECIAAEIGVSKKIEAIGLSCVQLCAQPFHVIRHREYNQDYPGWPFSHDHLPRNPPTLLGFRLRSNLAVFRFILIATALKVRHYGQRFGKLALALCNRIILPSGRR